MPQTRNVRPLKALLHIIFFLSGIATVLIGQILPILARHFTLSDLQVSFFFPAQFAGSADGRDLGSRSACALGLRLVDAGTATPAALTGIPELVGERPPLDAGSALALPARVLDEADARHPIVPERAIASSM